MRAIVLIFLLLSAFLSRGGELVRVSNQHLQLSFNSTNGQLVEAIDLHSRHNFVGGPSDHGLWQLNLRQQTSAETATASDSSRFAFEKTGSRSVRLTWDRLGRPTAPELRVQVTVELDAEKPISRWRMAVDQLGELKLHDIRFPRFPRIAPQANEYLAAPQWMGQVTGNPRELLDGSEKKGRRLEWDYPGIMSLQCMAFYRSNGPGLLFSCDDTNTFRKSFAFIGNGKGDVQSEIVHLPENNITTAKRFELPYAAIIGTFNGDWFTAADIYRGWATNQWWARESRLAHKKNPTWVPKTALWVWNRGVSENVLQPALALQKELDLPVSAMWHWWHGCAYDVGFPEYLPPREGNESFSKALAQSRKKDINAIVYMNQRLWGMTTKSWVDEGAEKFAVKNAQGKVHPEVYNSFTKSPCASMCMGTPFWREKYATLSEQAYSLGVSGIYMDQACSSLACYDTAHGHPVGGGKYWMNGFRLLATDIRNRVAASHRTGTRNAIGLAGEGVGESWLPYLDLMLSLQVSKERYSAPDSWEPIPFFQAVYHPFAIQYGNYSSLTMPPYDELWPKESAPKEPLKLLDRKFSRQFLREQARAFIWGQQPTIANFRPSHLEERSEEIEFVLRLAKLRQRALKYLLHGTFLRAPDLPVPETMIDISRLSIYAGQQGGLSTFQKRVPLVLAATWQATDGDVGIAVVNLADESYTGTLKLDASHAIAPKSRVYQLTDKSRKSLGHLADSREVHISLPPRGASVIEFNQ